MIGKGFWGWSTLCIGPWLRSSGGIWFSQLQRNGTQIRTGISSFDRSERSLKFHLSSCLVLILAGHIMVFIFQLTILLFVLVTSQAKLSSYSHLFSLQASQQCSDETATQAHLRYIRRWEATLTFSWQTCLWIESQRREFIPFSRLKVLQECHVWTLLVSFAVGWFPFLLRSFC